MADKITQKTIVLPISASEYSKFMLDKQLVHQIIGKLYNSSYAAVKILKNFANSFFCFGNSSNASTVANFNR